jgi:succinate-semialdehyde dehydrogenase/glutarate-semialdehyde dehydrogenase
MIEEALPFIAGSWRKTLSEKIAPSFNPSTGDVLGSYVLGTPEDIDDAVSAAAGAQLAWARASAFERAAACDRVASSLVARRDELALLLSLDQGKPLHAEAYDEVDELVVYFSMAAADATRSGGSMPPSTSAARRVLSYRVPVGTVGAITPWNWPYTMAAELLAPALAAGNAVVWVPAPTTALCSSLLAGIIGEELPPGVFNFVPGAGPVVGAALCRHPKVAAIGFIGSIASGAEVARNAAGKRQILELGGNGPMVILDDADLEVAVRASTEAAFLCAGQSCSAGELFLVHEAVHEEYLDLLLSVTASSVRLGDPLDPMTTMGPLNNAAVADKVASHVAEAKTAGAGVLMGGSRATGFATDLFYEPTVLDGVRPGMAIVDRETFGPVVPVLKVAAEAEALELLNRSPYGLTAAVFTRDLARGLAFAERAEVGWVNINASTNLWESHLAFGGRAGSASGIGRVGGTSTQEAFTEAKTVTFVMEQP